ncbi:HNH endonuclease [Gloeothece verrucosa]|uniref:HNH endonuclease n=1 Tax=Gloeothece verrucosa (strain PCC 7822) TaxID=497965 RepID=E0ULX9_GLOV7|nr:HNH endonuclease signature motif containing protein [Gloeothece verrucosa]ADN17959.1 HNH endonuclease [Gloeothece verrucosa PCC 7822]
MLEDSEIKEIQEISQKAHDFNIKLAGFLKKNEKRRQELEEKNDPRHLFNKWKGSKDGQDWKQKQYAIQQGLCAMCKKSMPLIGSHIDHIKPISTHPQLALDVSNLRLLCPACNTSKGNK